jgi:hypothetical protein
MFDALQLSDAKAIAKRLSKYLATQGFRLKHSQALELSAAAFGFRDFNTLSAALPERAAPTAAGGDRPPALVYSGEVIDFLRELFTENHVGRNGKNPQAAFLVGWEDHQLDRLAELAQHASTRLGRKPVLVDAAHKTPLSFYSDIAGAEFRSANEAAGIVAAMLYHDDIVLIVKAISRLNDAGKSRQARWIAKVIDDAHFDHVHPKADIIFVDCASFLEKSYRVLGPYVRVLAEPSWRF